MNLLRTIAAFQADSESGLSLVRRWSQFNADEARSQSTLQHSFSIQYVSMVVVWALRKGGFMIDGCFLADALTLHDVGERHRAAIGCDVLLANKSRDSDRLEYEAFCQYIDPFPPDLQETMLGRYLLQYVGREVTFDKRAATLLENLSATRYQDAQAFQMVERLDYVTYAWHAFEKYGNLRALIDALRNSHGTLTRFACDFPTFNEFVYTNRTIQHFDRLLAEYEGCKLSDIPSQRESANAIPEQLPLYDQLATG